MLHCHVAEHMESGMMALYTIYQPQRCSSPIQFVSADLGHTPGKITVTMKNLDQNRHLKCRAIDKISLQLFWVGRCSRESWFTKMEVPGISRPKANASTFYWRHQEHPASNVLPPLFVEMHED